MITGRINQFTWLSSTPPRFRVFTAEVAESWRDTVEVSFVSINPLVKGGRSHELQPNKWLFLAVTLSSFITFLPSSGFKAWLTSDELLITSLKRVRGAQKTSSLTTCGLIVQWRSSLPLRSSPQLYARFVVRIQV